MPPLSQPPSSFAPRRERVGWGWTQKRIKKLMKEGKTERRKKIKDFRGSVEGEGGARDGYRKAPPEGRPTKKNRKEKKM